jgi:hypothetical protein
MSCIWFVFQIEFIINLNFSVDFVLCHILVPIAFCRFLVPLWEKKMNLTLSSDLTIFLVNIFICLMKIIDQCFAYHFNKRKKFC